MATPLRDGMNLVAKEFLAAQDPDDPGVLVLSQFAGAAAKLDQALIVNPHEIEGVAAALKRALEMPLRGAPRAPRADARLSPRTRHQALGATTFSATLGEVRQRGGLLDGLRALFGASPEPKVDVRR